MIINHICSKRKRQKDKKQNTFFADFDFLIWLKKEICITHANIVLDDFFGCWQRK